MSASSVPPAPLDLDALRAAYSRFLSKDRILLSGHSHQAWPDVARDALGRFFDDSAELVDAKWDEVVFPKMQKVGAAILERMHFDAGDPIAFAASTHELVYRLISSFPMRERPRVVTTTGEFHSLWRQLARLEEEGLDVAWVDAQPRDGLADRVLAAIQPGTRLVALSAVMFEDAYVVPRLGEIVERAVAVGAIPLVDAYHAFNVVPIAWGQARDALFVTAGGYKYAGWGEGLCWLRAPRGSELRPAQTGWFADFASLSKARTKSVAYASDGMRFAGSTFDANGVWRAEAVLDHWDRFALTPSRLRAISVRQTRRIIARVDASGGGAIDVASSRDDARRGGFVALRFPDRPDTRAADLVPRLRERGVWVDARRDLLRLGPAPYTTDDEIDRGVDIVVETMRHAAG